MSKKQLTFGFAEPSIAMVAIEAMKEPELLALFASIGQLVAQRCMVNRPVMSSFATVIEYLKSAMAFEPVEHFRILYLDKRNKLIADEECSRGTVDHCPVYPREIL